MTLWECQHWTIKGPGARCLVQAMDREWARRRGAQILGVAAEAVLVRYVAG